MNPLVQVVQDALVRFHGHEVDERMIENCISDTLGGYFNDRVKGAAAYKLISRDIKKLKLNLDRRVEGAEQHENIKTD
jgi:hypothetical protein